MTKLIMRERPLPVCVDKSKLNKHGLVRVQFHRHTDGDAAGRSEAFPKIAFIARSFTGTKPTPGQTWWCRVDFDTKPAEARKGAVIITPVYDVNAMPPAELYFRHQQPENDGKPRKQGTLSLPGRKARKGGKRILVVTPEMQRGKKRKPTSASAPTMLPDGSEVAEPKKTSEWTAVLQHGTPETIKVTVVTMQAGLTLGRVEHTISDWSEITTKCAGAPFGVSGKIHELMRGIADRRQRAAQAERVETQRRLAEERRRQEEETRLRREAAAREKKAAEDARQAEEEERKFYRAGLTNPQPTTVVSITPVSHRIVAIRSGHPTFPRYTVSVDGEEKGQWNYDSTLRPTDCPHQLDGLTIGLSNGKSFTVFAHDVSAWTGTKLDRQKVLFRNTCEVAGVQKQTVTWSQAQALTVGSAFAQDFPFQWAGDFLTNGEFWFPRERPIGSVAWSKLPVPSIPAELWNDFLQGLEGKFLVEVIPYHREVTNRQKREKEHKLTERQQKLQSVILGKMWKGGEGCTKVALGRNVVFHVQRTSLSPVYVVDNPGVGSMYFFDDEADALALASGEMTRTEARPRFLHIDHRDGWEAAAAELLANWDDRSAKLKAAA